MQAGRVRPLEMFQDAGRVRPLGTEGHMSASANGQARHARVSGNSSELSSAFEARDATAVS